ncbi:primosomal protein N' [Candidatus Pantoea edessiphila]|uniref:Replication restart protein PriA n=1 Tax=Candidatus Pantoea edessiphila TaxID=2044610 RepID=A0A2P5SZ63_9GAMM|nr:primosomal protein N' [Candidatus Pantoea edessiphila]MBK4775271.1 primosomal protein N' [Pantoea sp. Edef]PPI87590.1 primosomal protein N' [Candidatus Pantoea edessiphila]
MSIVQIALPVPLNRLFNYIYPEDVKPVIGSRVRVTFCNRQMIGIIVSLYENNNLDYLQDKKIRNIEDILDEESLFSSSLWKLLQWAADYYHAPLGAVLSHAIPVLLRQGKSINYDLKWLWKLTEKGNLTRIESLKNAPIQQKALKLLRQRPIICDNIKKNHDITNKIMHNLHSKGLCTLKKNYFSLQNWSDNFIIKGEKPKLNKEQIIAINTIRKEDKKYSPWLLAGITSSGKTEVYLQIVENILIRSKQALILVPEIGLTIQTVNVFRERFNAPIDLLHSALNNKERLAVWLRARRGENAIIIGTRSALFTPLARPGIIIIDEEHDSSYKQQDGWRYQARDLAVYRAYKENIPIIMGSATPAIETLYNVSIGKYRQLNLLHRAGNAKLVIQQVIDIKGATLIGGLSPVLINKIKCHLHAKNQVLLFLNRRGFAPLLLCHECSWIAECQNCDHKYTLHRYKSQLRCHYCNHKEIIPNMCPRCNVKNLIPVGIGTEQIEDKLSNLFPSIKIIRIDQDTIRNKDSLKKYIDNINRGEPCILIGTQMITKGHHFPNVTLVSLLNVDGALFSSDFRATERFAQLYTQVSGRAGRADKQGEVLLQTYYPKHPLLKTLLNKGYFSFANQILLERKTLLLPPWTSHILLRAEDYDSKKVVEMLQKSRDLLENISSQDKFIWFMGPSPSLQHKKNKRWRWHLLIQHPSRKYLQQLIKRSLPLIYDLVPESRKVKFIIDIDPNEF